MTVDRPTASLYDTDGTFIADLPLAAGIQWQDELSAPGALSLRLPLDDSATLQATARRIFKVSWRGQERQAARIDASSTEVAVDGRVWREWSNLPGLLSVLGGVPVYPEYGLNRASNGQRTFGYMARQGSGEWLASGNWTDAIGVSWASMTGVRAGKPEGLDYPNPQWIAKRGPDNAEPPLSYQYFRRRFTTSTAMTVQILCTADNFLDLWLDGEHLVDAAGQGEFAWREAQLLNVLLPVGWHVLAARVRNQTDPSSGYNPMALLVTVQQTATNGDVIATTPLINSNTNWSVSDVTPGWLRAEALAQLWAEASSYQYAATDLLTLGFTVAVDSDGEEWTETPGEYTVDVGSSLLDVVSAFTEKDVDMGVDPGSLHLQMWNRRGSDLTGTVQLLRGVDGGNLIAHRVDTTEPKYNTILMQLADGRWVQRQNAASVAVNGREGGGLAMGSTTSTSTANQTADAQLAEASERSAAFTTEVSSLVGPQPYADFDLGDTITVPDEDGTGVYAARVMAITVDVPDDGSPVKITPELMRDRSATPVDASDGGDGTGDPGDLGDDSATTGGSTGTPTGDSGAPAGGGGTSTAGSADMGTATYSPPSEAVYVAPGGSDGAAGTSAAPFSTVAHAVGAVRAAGGTVVVRGGVYHESFQHATGGQPVTVQNYPGEEVWFDGSTVVTGWAASGSTWTHAGIPTKFARSGTQGWGPGLPAKTGGDPHGDKSDQVFIDGAPLHQIADGATPGAGQFSVNYPANTITIGSDPTGREVRVSDLRYLCVASGPLSWKGVGVRRYSPDNTNAVGAPLYYGGTSAGSLFENLIVERSAMSALNLSKHDMIVRNCTLRDNAFGGVLATTCDGLQVRDCAITGNNTGLFKPAPQTGAVKVTRCVGVTIDNVYAADNNGAIGLWLDVSVVQFQVSNSQVVGNHEVGLNVEESDGGNVGGVQHRGAIAGNRVDGARFGSQVFVAGNIDFYNNEIKNCSTAYLIVQNDRGGNTSNNYLTQAQCPWDCRNIDIANNIFGPGSPVAKVRYFDSLHNNSADSLGGMCRSNEFKDSAGSLIQWGTGTNAFASYSDPASAASAHPSSLSGNQQGAGMVDADALPLPSGVAAALGLASGTKKLGPV